MLNTCVRRHQAHQRRQRIAQGDANTEPYSSHDCQDCSCTGRHHRVSLPLLVWHLLTLHVIADQGEACKSCRDGTTSTVLLIGELMKQAERYLGEGLHPRVIVEVSTSQAQRLYIDSCFLCCSCCPLHSASQPFGGFISQTTLRPKAAPLIVHYLCCLWPLNMHLCRHVEHSSCFATPVHR